MFRPSVFVRLQKELWSRKNIWIVTTIFSLGFIKHYWVFKCWHLITKKKKNTFYNLTRYTFLNMSSCELDYFVFQILPFVMYKKSKIRIWNIYQ